MARPPRTRRQRHLGGTRIGTRGCSGTGLRIRAAGCPGCATRTATGRWRWIGCSTESLCRLARISKALTGHSREAVRQAGGGPGWMHCTVHRCRPACRSIPLRPAACQWDARESYLGHPGWRQPGMAARHSRPAPRYNPSAEQGWSAGGQQQQAPPAVLPFPRKPGDLFQ